MKIRAKTRVSPALEALVFEKTLRKREIEALRTRCESYQAGAPPHWKNDVFEPYAQYFGLLSALKVSAALSELDAFGYLDIFDQGVDSLIDFGAGTLGASLGAFDFFSQKKVAIRNWSAIDRDKTPLQWAQERYQDFFKQKANLGFDLSQVAAQERSLVIAVDVLNEMGVYENPDRLDFLVGRLKESSLLILIEPANKTINQNFLKLRDHWKDRAQILLPCTHAKACPALKQNEWCHEERSYLAPSAYWNLVHELGFERPYLGFSLLVLGNRASAFQSSDARMVSRALKSKGKTERWLCRDGERWKESFLKRFQNEENAWIYEAERGTIITEKELNDVKAQKTKSL